MNKKWWHNLVVYQIYPRSFKDSNGDGVGDIKGIINKLDYLQNLGIRVIWLSPIYQSPMDDNGYDISDYQQIAPEFGTMEDFDELIEETKKRNIKIVMDLVVNHTSDEHPWFIESKSSVDNAKRDWYIWKDPKADGSEPNNWESHFTRSAWEFQENTQQYYLHLFSKKQPDLNWSNPEVREAIYEMMHFWLAKGIGGFRMDVINMIGKPADYPDACIKDGQILGHEHWANNSRTHEYLREMNEKVLSHYDILTVGETPHVTPYEGSLYSHPDRHELGMIFQFDHMGLDKGGLNEPQKPLNLVKLKKVLAKWQESLYKNGWNSNFWCNHDQPRIVSRFGNDTDYRVESAKMLGTTLHMMFGTPYIYQGEEIGTSNTYYESIDDYNDLSDHHRFDLLTHEYGCSPEEALKLIQPFSRDNSRVPINWDNSQHGGFTRGIPWLKWNKNYMEINVKAAIEDKNSVFYHYKELVKLRQDSVYSQVIIYGRHTLLDAKDRDVYAYIPRNKKVRLLILSNFTDKQLDRTYYLSAKKLILGNYERDEIDLEHISLMPYESMIIEI